MQELLDNVRSALRAAKSLKQRRQLHFWAPGDVAARLRDALTQSLEYANDDGNTTKTKKRVLLLELQVPSSLEASLPVTGHRLLEHALKKRNVFAAVAAAPSVFFFFFWLQALQKTHNTLTCFFW